MFVPFPHPVCVCVCVDGVNRMTGLLQVLLGVMEGLCKWLGDCLTYTYIHTHAFVSRSNDLQYAHV